jgi:hypothetical protein
MSSKRLSVQRLRQLMESQGGSHTKELHCCGGDAYVTRIIVAQAEPARNIYGGSFTKKRAKPLGVGYTAATWVSDKHAEDKTFQSSERRAALLMLLESPLTDIHEQFPFPDLPKSGLDGK